MQDKKVSFKELSPIAERGGVLGRKRQVSVS